MIKRCCKKKLVLTSRSSSTPHKTMFFSKFFSDPLQLSSRLPSNWGSKAHLKPGELSGDGQSQGDCRVQIACRRRKAVGRFSGSPWVPVLPPWTDDVSYFGWVRILVVSLSTTVSWKSKTLLRTTHPSQPFITPMISASSFWDQIKEDSWKVCGISPWLKCFTGTNLQISQSTVALKRRRSCWPPEMGPVA